VLLHRQVVVEDVVLRAEAQDRVDLVDLVAEVVAEHAGRAAGGRVEPAEHEGRGGLARAVVADNARHLVFVEVERKVLHRLLLLLELGERLQQENKRREMTVCSRRGK